MECPACNARIRRLRVHDDEVPFHYHECAECGWDDYDEQATLAVRNTTNEDDYEYETDC